MRVLYDDRALYVAVRCDDRTPSQIIPQLTRRDRDTNADRVTVDVDSRGDGQSAYHFGVNVSGVLTDGTRANDTDYNGDWDGLWEGEARRDRGGYSVELEIPWSTLRFEGGSPVMGLEVRRVIQRRMETDAWAAIPRSAHAEVSRYGRLLGVEGIGKARLFHVWPYAAVRVALREHTDVASGPSLTPEVGADLKLGLTSSLTLDATVNPDFGQVEADQVQLNLSTFELFYPEKRPFFLEGVDLFATLLKQFYTRRIGRSPPEPTLGAGEALVDESDTGRIWTAARVTGQIVPRLQLAAIEALTAAQEATVQTTDGRRVQRLTDPLANYAVLRLRYDRGQSSLGVTGTAVDRFEPDGAMVPDPTTQACPDGDLPSPFGIAGLPPSRVGTVGGLVPPVRTPPLARSVRGRCSHDAYTAGVDGRMVLGGGDWIFAGHAVLSRRENGPPRTRPDGVVLRPGDTGYGLLVGGGRQGGEHFLFGATYEAYSPTLDLNDAGFLREANLHRINATTTLRSTTPVAGLREASWDLFTYHRLDWRGVVLDQGLGTWLWARLPSFATVGTGGGYTFPTWDNRETRDGAYTQRANGWWWSANARSDPRKAVIASAWVDTGHRQVGAAVDGGFDVTLRPVQRVELEIAPHLGYTFGDPRWYDTDTLGDGTRVYRFGELASTVFDVTLRGIYTFTPRLTLQAYAQLFVAAGHYDHFRSATGGGERPFLPMTAFVGERCAYATPGDAPCDPASTPDFRSGAINANVVLRWEYATGSTLLAVYTHSQGQADYHPLAEGPGGVTFSQFRGGPTVDLLLVKLTYLM